MNAKNLTKFLQENGYPDAKLIESEAPEMWDDEIKINKKVSVQVLPRGIYVVNAWVSKSRVRFAEPLKGKNLILNKIHYFVKETSHDTTGN